MPDNIFKSKICLSFTNEEVEKNYSNHSTKERWCMIRILLAILSLISIYISVHSTYYLTKYKNDNNQILMIAITSYICTLLYSFVCIIYLKNKTYAIPKFLVYILHFLIVVLFLDFRLIINMVFTNQTQFSYYLLLIEIMIRIIWTNTGVQPFKVALISTAISIIYIWLMIFVSGVSILEKETYYNAIYNKLSYTFSILLKLILSYYLERNSRLQYYYYSKSLDTLKWTTDILQNINSGLISINNGNIKFINENLKNTLLKMNHNILGKFKFNILEGSLLDEKGNTVLNVRPGSWNSDNLIRTLIKDIKYEDKSKFF